MAKANITIITSDYWRKKYGVKKVLNPGDPLPTGLAQEIGGNSPYLSDDYERRSNGNFYLKKGVKKKVEEVKEPIVEESTKAKPKYMPKNYWSEAKIVKWIKDNGLVIPYDPEKNTKEEGLSMIERYFQ